MTIICQLKFAQEKHYHIMLNMGILDAVRGLLYRGGKTTKKAESQFAVYKQADGQYRWVGISTNNFIDLDGEILTESAHLEFLDYLDHNPSDAPESWCWHTPGTARKHRADWWDYANGFVIFSGLFEESEALPYLINTDEPIGMSHGFYILQRDKQYITKYRTFEISDLLLDHAANPYTEFGVIMAQKGFSEARRNYLVDRLGEEVVADLESGLERKESILTALDIQRKEQKDGIMAVEQQEKELAVKTMAEQTIQQIKEVLNLEGLNAMLVDLQTTADTQMAELASGLQAVVSAVTELNRRLAIVEDVVVTLQMSTDERIAEVLSKEAPLKVSWGSQLVSGTAAAEIADMKKTIADNTWMAGLDPRS